MLFQRSAPRAQGTRPIWGFWIAALIAAVALPACSTAGAVVDRLNPANLFTRSAGEPESEEAAVARARGEEAVEAGADEPYPRLSRVPERPQIISRRDVRRGLAADRANAAYTGSTLRGSDLPAPPPVPSRGQQAIRQTSSTTTGPASDVVGMAALQEELAVGEPVRVAVIQFPFNSTEISRDDQSILGQVVELAEATGSDIVVVGHASGPSGEQSADREEANLRVSLNRANAVADSLIGLGADPNYVVIQAKGDNEPAYDEATPEGQAGNRRAEVFLRQ
ncbi:MAG: OmpA family protein [Alphaproteobacteria bacterium]|nr:OmpA family protein [Alphaproteobacteria bacterium]